jgi:hypothetical protein
MRLAVPWSKARAEAQHLSSLLGTVWQREYQPDMYMC